MDGDTIYGVKYLKKDDIGPRDTVVTVKDVWVDELDGRKRIILEFQEFDHPMVVNVTNYRTIRSIYGNETDDWLGKQLVIWAHLPWYWIVQRNKLGFGVEVVEASEEHYVT